MRHGVLLFVLTAAALGGCSNIQDFAIKERDRNLAYKAWKAARWDYYRQGTPYCVREHIGRGFRQGFCDVAAGGSGQLPLFAPSMYWGPEYQNPRGTEFIAAYFRGYQDGAVAAEKTGIAMYNTLPASGAPHTVTNPTATADYRIPWMREGAGPENVPQGIEDDNMLHLPDPLPRLPNGPDVIEPPPVLQPPPPPPPAGKTIQYRSSNPIPPIALIPQIRQLGGAAASDDAQAEIPQE